MDRTHGLDQDWSKQSDHRAGLQDLLFAKGTNLVQKKKQILRQRAKKSPTIYSKFISSYEGIWPHT